MQHDLHEANTHITKILHKKWTRFHATIFFPLNSHINFAAVATQWDVNTETSLWGLGTLGELCDPHVRVVALPPEIEVAKCVEKPRGAPTPAANRHWIDWKFFGAYYFNWSTMTIHRTYLVTLIGLVLAHILKWRIYLGWKSEGQISWTRQNQVEKKTNGGGGGRRCSGGPGRGSARSSRPLRRRGKASHSLGPHGNPACVTARLQLNCAQ